jgi:hypothetical protein
VDIVINSYVIIKKMEKMQYCGWDISELRYHLNSGVIYYYENNIHSNKTPVVTKKTKGYQFESDIRKKFPATIKTQDGHYVRSKAELIIDDFLYLNNIVHSYEKKLPIEEVIYCDFYIPSAKDRPHEVYIEFWGLNNDPKYLRQKEFKRGVYKKYAFALIEIEESDISNLQEILTWKLLRYNIRIF